MVRLGWEKGCHRGPYFEQHCAVVPGRGRHEACTKISPLSSLSPPSTSFYSRPVLGKHLASSPRAWQRVFSISRGCHPSPLNSRRR